MAEILLGSTKSCLYQNSGILYKTTTFIFYFSFLFKLKKNILQVNFIRDNKDKIVEGLRVRNFAEEDLHIIDDIIRLDDEEPIIKKVVKL